MNPDDYTDPTKWMEQQPRWIRNPEYDRLGPDADVEFIYHPSVVLPLPKPQSPGESGFDLED